MAGGGPAAGLRVGQMHPVLGPDRPPRHQQPVPVRTGHRIRVNDPQVHAGDPARVRRSAVRVDGDRDLGGDLQPQPATVGEQCHRPDPLGRIRHGPIQVQPQRRATGRGWQPQLPAVQGERAVIPADRHQTPATAGELTGPWCRQRGGVTPRRTRHRRTGAAPTGHRHCPGHRTCPDPPRPVPGTTLDTTPAARPAAAAAMHSPRGGTPIRHRPTATTQNRGSAVLA